MTKRASKAKAASPAPIEREDRPLTPSDRVEAFRTVTRSFASHYAAEIAVGMTGAALTAALEHSIGIMGGSCGPGCMDLSYAGAGLRIWAGWTFQNTVTDKPILSGAATVAMARAVYGIADPEARQLALL